LSAALKADIEAIKNRSITRNVSSPPAPGKSSTDAKKIDSTKVMAEKAPSSLPGGVSQQNNAGNNPRPTLLRVDWHVRSLVVFAELYSRWDQDLET
jgi:hypothetical protein